MLYLLTILVLIVYLVLVWLLGWWLPLHGSDVWILRGVLAFLGFVGTGVALWYEYKVKKAKEASGEGESQAGPTDDLDALVHESVRRLKHSTLGRGTNLGSLPLVFVLGDSGSTKTTVLIHSALDPELLAGQVYRDNEVLPTSAANIWYTREAIFVDPAGALMGQADRWRRLVRLLQPGRFSAALGKRAQAPRAAVVCFDCETFLKPGASEAAVSAARRLSVRLQEVSQLLGISFPVYVLFTKLDRISFFADFVRGMSKDEASEVLGATLPLRSLSAGVYADEETRRLTKAFDDIFYSLAERRILLLPREHEGDKLPGIYEFPRELRKLRTLLVQFLVDLARPSHLGTNPFLRGFYFTGVRPVVMEDVVAAPAAPAEGAEAGYGGGATQIFRGVGAPPPPPPGAMRSGGSRRVPQWVFLTSLFNDVLVKDRVALATSGSSSRVNLLRRIALGSALLVALTCLTGFAVSFFRNRALETRVQDAVGELKEVRPGTSQSAAGLSDLTKLDNLRRELVDLNDYAENGPPLSLRWFLYDGDQIYLDAKRVYFLRFKSLLFAEAQRRVTDNLGAVAGKSATNAPNDSYQKTYDELKAYLITTDPGDHVYSTPGFLTPVLMNHWIGGRDIDKERRDLATLQFDFFVTELAKENPFPTGISKDLRDGARAYLKGFTGIDRNYAQLLSKVTQKDVSFNDQFPDSAGVIVSSHKVKGAFLAKGFSAVQDALKNPANIGGEEWVVGKSELKDMDPDVMRQDLTKRYNQDFVNEWNTVLKTSSVAGYGSNADADKKLEKLTGPTSPLLELLYFISHNTDPAPADVKKPFAAVPAIEPPGPPDTLPDKYILPTNKDYVDALVKLQADIHALAQNPGAPDPAQLTQAQGSADAASQTAKKTIDSGPVDQQFKNQDEVGRLLQEPIKNVEALLKRGPIDIANAAGKGYCSAFAGLASKYPLDPNSLQELSMDQLYSILGPTSDGLKKLKDGVKPYTLMVGNKYAQNPQATVKPSPSFLLFLNRIVGLSETLYPTGSLPPKFSYTLKQLPSNLPGVVLKIGSEPLSGDGAQKTYVWTGTPEEIEVTTKGGDTLDSVNGPWAVFKFVARAHQMGAGKLEWVSETNDKPVMLPNGKVKSYDYQLQVSASANPFFDLQGMKCVSQITGR